MSVQLVSSEDPPYATKGRVRPVSGITRVTPPMTTKIWIARTKVRPVASSLPKPSRRPIAERRPRSMSTA